MMASIIGSFVSLFWSIIMLGVILYVFGLFFLQQMTAHMVQVTEEMGDDSLFEKQRAFFGNIGQVILTLAMCTTGGKDWGVIYDLLLPVGPFSLVVFVFYITFFTFAVMNILTGIFVENALQLAQPDPQEALLAHAKQRTRELEELTGLMNAIDGDGNGEISCDEFVRAMENEKVRGVLRSVGVDIKEPELYFKTMSFVAQREHIDLNNFAEQALRLKGAASGIDLHSLIHETKLVRQNIHDIYCQQKKVALLVQQGLLDRKA